MAYGNNELSPDRVTRLAQLGFAWDPLATAWDQMFAKLAAYKATHGDASVPQGWAGNAALGTWCNTQRNKYRSNNLSPYCVARLEQLGFIWGVSLSAGWEQMFAELTAYVRIFGDANVPQKWLDNPRLGQWCSHQRTAYAKNELSSERVARLEQLGFVWDAFSVAWDEMFAELEAYKLTNGDCTVPKKWQENPELGIWCGTQKYNYARNNLSQDRIQRLEQLGFAWNQFSTAWEQMFAALTTYKQRHGDCNVPQKGADNLALGTWCSTQRRTYKSNKLSADRYKKLMDLGFQFGLHVSTKK